jgi:hypothetical protein
MKLAVPAGIDGQTSTIEVFSVHQDFALMNRANIPTSIALPSCPA